MMKNTHGYIYFALKTEEETLDERLFTSMLTIKPTRFEKRFERGQVPVCTVWELSSRELINPNYSDELEHLIDLLNLHLDELLNLKRNYPEVEFWLQVVMYLGDYNPALHFGKKVLKFCNDLDVKIDCDIYNDK